MVGMAKLRERIMLNHNLNLLEELVRAKPGLIRYDCDMNSNALFPDLETPARQPLAGTPLAYELAPKSLNDYVGQSHLVGPNGPVRNWLEKGTMPSVIFYGPPGIGKTALSRLIASLIRFEFVALNAVMAKVQDLRDALHNAESQRRRGHRTLLFIDEIHRFNKSQQDALLPDLEKGTVTLIGATTENPYFSVNPSILSRCQIFELNPLSETDLLQVFERAIQHPRLASIQFESVKTDLLKQSQGDARRLINLIEAVSHLADSNGKISAEKAAGLILQTGIAHSDDSHYDIASAFIKSLRGSDANAALYWLARLLKGGEDPRFIVRRLIILASEDIGNADPNALVLAVAAMHAVQMIGLPEAQLTLSQTVIYLANAPKSNTATVAIGRAMKYIDAGNIHPVPDHLRDAHYKGATQLGHGQGYVYPHDFPEDAKNQRYWDGTERFV